MSDRRYAWRTLRQSPNLTIAAVAALAIGIGANTAIFTVVNAVILQPLPYPDSDRMVVLSRPAGGRVSEPLFAFWIRNNPGFADLAAYQAGAGMNLSGGDQPELVETIDASENYFRLFGAHPILGRTFTAAEDAPKGGRALVMSYGLWRRRFCGDPSILGKTSTLGVRRTTWPESSRRVFSRVRRLTSGDYAACGIDATPPPWSCCRLVLTGLSSRFG